MSRSYSKVGSSGELGRSGRDAASGASYGARGKTRSARAAPTCSGNVGRIDVVLIFFRLVTGKTLLGGIGHQRLLGISALPKLEAPAAGRCILFRVLHHDGQALASAFHVRAVGNREFMQVGREHSLVGIGSALLERG